MVSCTMAMGHCFISHNGLLPRAAPPAFPSQLTSSSRPGDDCLAWKSSTLQGSLLKFSSFPRFGRLSPSHCLWAVRGSSDNSSPSSLPLRRSLFRSLNRDGRSRLRLVSVEAGRSKGKRGRTSGGRIESFNPPNTEKQKKKQQQQGGSKSVGTKDNSSQIGKDSQASVSPGRRQRKFIEHNVRQPDDYYKYGPYGPYANKAIVVGTAKKATIAQEHVTFWSPVKNEEEFVKRDIYDAMVVYEDRISKFNEDAGFKFFLVFVRHPYRTGYEVAWKEWTVVSQVTVESGEELDKWTLASKLDQIVRNNITRCTGWFRPDLVYVRKPMYQVRFEPQEEFLRELIKLLEVPAGEPQEKDSYYGKFCQILGVDVNASHKVVISKYEESTEERQLACLEHLLTNNPAHLLQPFPRQGGWVNRDRREHVMTSDEITIQPNLRTRGERRGVMGAEEDKSGGLDTASEDYGEEENEEGWSDDDGDEEEDFDDDNYENEYRDTVTDDEVVDDWNSEDEGEEDDDDLESRMDQPVYALKEEDGLLDRSEDSESYGEASDLDAEDFKTNYGEGHKKTAFDDAPFSEFLVRAAARPFTYVNFIKEIVMLRQNLVQRKRNAQNRSLVISNGSNIGN